MERAGWLLGSWFFMRLMVGVNFAGRTGIGPLKGKADLDDIEALVMHPHYRKLAMTVIAGAAKEWRRGDYQAGWWMRETGVYWLQLCGFDLDPGCLEAMLMIK